MSTTEKPTRAIYGTEPVLGVPNDNLRVYSGEKQELEVGIPIPKGYSNWEPPRLSGNLAAYLTDAGWVIAQDIRKVSLSVLKAVVLKRYQDRFEVQVDDLDSKYSSKETSSFTQQKNAARALLEGDTSASNMVAALAKIRGTDPVVLAKQILAKADKRDALYTHLLGTYQVKCEEVNNVRAIDQLPKISLEHIRSL